MTRVALIQTQAEAAGAQEISRLLARELAARGHEVRQVFLFRRTAAFDDDPRAAFCAPERPTGPLALARMAAELHRQLRSLRPDAAICFQHYGNLVGGLAARTAGVPRIIANHNGMQNLLSRPVVLVDRLLGTAGIFSAIVTNSAETEAEYSAYPARYRSRLHRIEHGFESKTSRLDRTAARSSFGLPADGALLGCVGRLASEKNIAAAIRVIAGRPDWRLAIAGQGPERADLERLATDLGCRDRVRFVGELAPDRIGDLLAALDVFLFPSRTETFGLAAVEAASAGVPVVASDLAVLRDVLSKDGEPCGLFVDPDDTPAFAAAIDSVLRDQALAHRLAERGRHLTRRFPLDAMVDGYEALIAGR